MAKYSIEDTTLTGIADAIRNKTGSTEPILTEDMAQGVVAASEKYRKKLTDLVSREITEISAQDLDGVFALGDNAFAYCTSLLTVQLAPSIRKLGDYTFQKCTSLACANLLKSSTIPTLSKSAFNGIPEYTKIIVPRGYGDTFASATNWSNFADRIVEADPDDKIGIVTIEAKGESMPFCFVKGMTWEDLSNNDFSVAAIYQQLLTNNSGAVVLDYDFGDRYYMLDGVTKHMVVTEGTYTTTEVFEW